MLNVRGDLLTLETAGNWNRVNSDAPPATIDVSTLGWIGGGKLQDNVEHQYYTYCARTNSFNSFKMSTAKPKEII